MTEYVCNDTNLHMQQILMLVRAVLPDFHIILSCGLKINYPCQAKHGDFFYIENFPPKFANNFIYVWCARQYTFFMMSRSFFADHLTYI